MERVARLEAFLDDPADGGDVRIGAVSREVPVDQAHIGLHVVVEDQDDPGPGGADSGVPGGAAAAIHVVPHHGQRQLPGEPAGRLRGGVGRGIVDDDHLEATRDLDPLERSEGARQAIGAAVRGDDDRDDGRRHAHPRGDPSAGVKTRSRKVVRARAPRAFMPGKIMTWFGGPVIFFALRSTACHARPR